MPTSKNSEWMRNFVKIVFILCYVAFMYASIHRVAVFFNNFEESNDMVGSYLLAGAFDITALVTTIAVMFFRKSMPVPVFVGVWFFIVAITGYSTFINWEYASHFQNMQLIMQATGKMIPSYDKNNVLHYIPEMKPNMALLYLNPLIASAFTAFSLVYSIVAEFFGSKPPTVAELTGKIEYLEQTTTLQKQLKELQEQTKGKSVVEKLKEKAIETYNAGKEVVEVVNGKQEDMVELDETTEEPEETSKLDLALAFIQNNPLATDQMLTDYLQVDIISARRWKTRALEVLQKSSEEQNESVAPQEEEQNVTSFQIEREKRGKKRGPKPGARKGPKLKDDVISN